jgi:hypothetical protein
MLPPSVPARQYRPERNQPEIQTLFIAVPQYRIGLRIMPVFCREAADDAYRVGSFSSLIGQDGTMAALR